MDSPHPITRVLESVESGDPTAARQLLPLLYKELRRLARGLMRKLPPGQTLQPTALVHEAYLKVAGRAGGGWESRRHFFAAAARSMRDILVDEARRKASLKRGGDRRRVPLEEEPLTIEGPREDVLALHQALHLLEQDDPGKAELINLRFFGGFTVPEIVAMLGVSERTVKRQLRYIRAWLKIELERGDDSTVD